GTNGLPAPSNFVSTLLFTARGLGLLVVGTTIGGILACLVFSISVVSVPLLMTRPFDVASAIAASFAVVVANPRPLLLWSGLIVAFTAMGIATLFVGLVIVFPLIGHATWHAFRALVAD